MTAPALVLPAGDLLERHGFGSGDLLDDAVARVAAAAGSDPDEPPPSLDGTGYSTSQAVLILAVERLLIPRIPVPVVTNRWSTTSNPIRAQWVGRHSVTTYDVPEPARAALAGVSLTLTEDDVRALYREIATSGLPPAPEQQPPELGDVARDGLAALVGRWISIQLPASFGEEAIVTGTLLAIHADGPVTDAHPDPGVVVTPWAVVGPVCCYELSPAEQARDDAIHDGTWSPGT